MPDIVITAASVTPADTTGIERGGIAGEAISPGQAVCQKDNVVGGKSVKRIWRAQADGSAEEKTLYGVAVTSALAAEQPIIVKNGGDVNIGGAVVVGTEYVLSATLGGICPHADLVTGNAYSRVGYGSAAGRITLDIKNTGLAIP